PGSAGGARPGHRGGRSGPGRPGGAGRGRPGHGGRARPGGRGRPRPARYPAGVNADPAAQLRLLDLQAADTALGQLTHRRATLPELAAIADADARLKALTDDLVRAQTEVADLDREQRRMEADVDQVRSRS